MENYKNIIHRARFLMKTNWLQAIQVLEEAAAENPQDTEIFIELGDIYSQKGSQKKALENYQKVLNIDPTNHIVRFKMGNIYLDINEPKLALYQYAQINTKMPEAQFNKAIAFERMLMFDEAIATLTNLIAENDVTSNAYFLLVEIFFNQGRYSEALYYLEEMERKFGNIPRIHYLKGIIYSYGKNWLVAYNMFLKIKNHTDYVQNPKFYHLLGIAAENIGQSDKAIQYLKQAITLRKDDKSIFIDLLKVLIRNNIITSTEELTPYINDMEDDVIKMAINLYTQFKDDLTYHSEDDLI